MKDEREPDGARRPPWSEFRSALDSAGFRPSRRLGQNFLRDENAVRAIVRDAEVAAGDFVLEIGPGCGFLTLHLARSGARVLAVEIDARLLAIASELVEGRGAVEFLHADALAGKHALATALFERLPARARWSVVSNLPYSIATPVVALLAALANPPARMTVLVQLEAAERLVASPGTPAYGPVSVKLALSYQSSILRRLSPELFWPKPKVDSAVVRLDLGPDRPSASDQAELDPLLAGLFQHRRKSLARLLSDLVGSRPAAAELCERQDLDPLERPEGLAPAQWLALARDPVWLHRPRSRPRKRD